MHQIHQIRDKQNANLPGGPVTLFDIYEKRAEGYVFQGKFAADGHDASDDQCLMAYIYAPDVCPAEDNAAYYGE